MPDTCTSKSVEKDKINIKMVKHVLFFLRRYHQSWYCFWERDGTSWILSSILKWVNPSKMSNPDPWNDLRFWLLHFYATLICPHLFYGISFIIFTYKRERNTKFQLFCGIPEWTFPSKKYITSYISWSNQYVDDFFA